MRLTQLTLYFEPGAYDDQCDYSVTIRADNEYEVDSYDGVGAYRVVGPFGDEDEISFDDLPEAIKTRALAIFKAAGFTDEECAVRKEIES